MDDKDNHKILYQDKIVGEYEFNNETKEMLVTITEWLPLEDEEVLKKEIYDKLSKTGFIIKFK